MAYSIKPAALPLAILAYAALAAAVSPASFLPMVQTYLTQAMSLPVILAIFLPLAAIIMRPRAPVRFILDVLREGGVRLIVVFLLFCVGLAAFTTLKLAIPRIVPFYADRFLADLDLWLHGANPGAIAHALVPSWAQYPLASAYGLVWLILWFGLVAFVALQTDAGLRFRYFWSMALTVCFIGTIAATAFSSVGPIFYANFVDPARFAGLIADIKASAAGEALMQTSTYLLASYHAGGGQAGAGISAMPSMHLAIVTLNACMLTSLNRIAGFFAWCYVAVILLGSVYLGWHYAIDGYFSIASVSLIWWAMGKVTQANAQRAPQTLLPAGTA